ncbi:MAG: hypothetical protein GX801_02105 [Fibrobacter sp.]|nr:hypothetical protein [Fibrobacter sp.]
MNSPTFSIKNYEMRIKHLCSRKLEYLRALNGEKFDLNKLLDFTTRLFELYDKWQIAMLKNREEPIACGSGCGSCCYHFPQSVEPFEALFLYVRLRQNPDMVNFIARCWDRVTYFGRMWKENVPKNPDEGDSLLQRYFMKQQPCPFLNKDQSCGVYKYRPMICRMYFSDSDPVYCGPKHLLSDENRAFHLCLPDHIELDLAEISQLLDLELSTSFYESILDLNALEGEGYFDAVEHIQ